MERGRATLRHLDYGRVAAQATARRLAHAELLLTPIELLDLLSQLVTPPRLQKRKRPAVGVFQPPVLCDMFPDYA